VESGPAVEITRRGRTVAVLLSASEYERLTSDKRGFWDAVEEFRRSVDPALLEPVDEIFEPVRDTSPGRDVDL
jgi:hypothetical protein